MTRTYKATGINLKGMPLGEADRLVTILTPEFGLIRAVAPGARKHKSKLRGRCELFVVNQLLIAKGRSLDKIIQADTLESYPGLSRNLEKLAASQYLAELVLALALSEEPQPELYELLTEHLRRLENSQDMAHAYLAQAVFHLLAIAGIGPQVQACCLTGEAIAADLSDPYWRAGFSFEAGGIIGLSVDSGKPHRVAESDRNPLFSTPINTKIGAIELTLLQKLGSQVLPPSSQTPSNLSLDAAWVKVERILRDYAQYHFGRNLRSAALVDALTSLEF